jgi:hypothetical protein
MKRITGILFVVFICGMVSCKSSSQTTTVNQIATVDLVVPNWVRVGMTVAEVQDNLPSGALKKNESDSTMYSYNKNGVIHQMIIFPGMGLMFYNISAAHNAVSAAEMLQNKYGPFAKMEQVNRSVRLIWDINRLNSGLFRIILTAVNDEFISITYGFEHSAETLTRDMYF